MEPLRFERIAFSKTRPEWSIQYILRHPCSTEKSAPFLLFVLFLLSATILWRFTLRTKATQACYRMAGRTVLRCVLLTEPCRPLLSRSSCSSVSYPRNVCLCSAGRLSGGYASPGTARDVRFLRTQQLGCSGNGLASPSSSDPSGDDQLQNPPQEAVLKAISGPFGCGRQMPNFGCPIWDFLFNVGRLRQLLDAIDWERGTTSFVPFVATLGFYHQFNSIHLASVSWIANSRFENHF